MEKHACFDCPCWECWTTDGFSASRCSECPHSTCPVEQGIHDDCVNRLYLKLESGDVQKLRQPTRFNPSAWKPPVPGNVWTMAEHLYLIEALQRGQSITNDIVPVLRRKPKDIEAHIASHKIPRGTEAAMEWCILCARKVPKAEYDEKAGFCNACVQHRHNEEQNIALDIEEYELRNGREGRENNRIKQQRKRMREPYQANPRKYR